MGDRVTVAPGSRRIIRLMWWSVGGAVTALLVAGGVYLRSELPGGPEGWGLVRGYGIAAAAFVLPALVLLWASVRGARRGTTGGMGFYGASVAVLCLIAAGFFCLPPFVRVVSLEIHNAILRTQEPTPTETSMSSTELRAAAEAVITESAAPLTDAEYPNDDSVVNPVECLASNLAPGTSWEATVSIDSAVPTDAFRIAVSTRWAEQGFTVTSTPSETTANGAALATARGDIVDRMSFTVEEPGRMVLYLRTICVVAD